MQKRGLARSRNACDCHQHAEWNLDIDVLQIVRPSPANRDLPSPRGTPVGGDWNVQFLGEITSGERGWGLLDLLVSSFCDHPAAVFAGARPQIEDVVARAHDIGIMLYHQHRVS